MKWYNKLAEALLIALPKTHGFTAPTVYPCVFFFIHFYYSAKNGLNRFSVLSVVDSPCPLKIR